MKTFRLIITGALILLAVYAQSQVAVNQWGPEGYVGVRYYYLPDVETYYDLESSTFIYMGTGGLWIRRTELPPEYKDYDLYAGYKVVLTGYTGDAPFEDFKTHKIKYAKGYRGKPQKTIGVKPGNESVKFKSSNHPKEKTKKSTPRTKGP
jgi:hypothetical protein